MDFLYANGLAFLAWTIACLWIPFVVIFFIASRKQSPLRPMADSPGLLELPNLSVIVAARNESACIETCIRSLFHQDYPDLEVVAVNDRSSDDTAQILERLALEFGDRLKVVHVSSLPSGWFGKPNALDLGMKSVTGSMVCFTDADCEFLHPAAMRTSVVEMLRGELDFLSIAARYTMNSLRECLAVPCCAEALLVWLRPERVSDPRWPDAFCNGAFIMVRREPFESIGGWGSVRSKISEDLELSRLFKRSGLRLAVVQGEGFYQTDSYATLPESWNGWSRIFKGALTPAQQIVTLFRMLFLFALPLGAMLWAMVQAFQTGSIEWLTHGTGLAFAIAFGLRCFQDVALFRLVGAPLAAAPLASFGRLFAMATIARALLSHAGLVNTYWRGATFVSGQMIRQEHVKV
jgi:cellulose synthase/poly-beta-1,6-N-acetylglucosamine synthase-like glycosyltransferase